MTVEELLGRTYAQGTTVVNCVAHMSMPITERPDDCRLCRADVSNTLARALRANEWLNEWKADAEKILRQT